MELIFIFTLCRQIGNFGLIGGYLIMLNWNMQLGLKLKITFGLLTIPSLIFMGLFDAAILVGFYLCIEGAALYKIMRKESNGNRNTVEST
jgi:hypothetical protein